jgi:hypothetical protein
MLARKTILALATFASLGTAALTPTSASAWGHLGRTLGRSLGWLGLGPPLGRMGLGWMGLAGMARPILRLAPVRRSLPGHLLRRRLCGSDRRPGADQRLLGPAARSGLPRQRIYARWQRGVHRPLHPGRRGCKLRASAARGLTSGWSATSTLKRPDACTISWSLAQTASRPRRQPRRAVSLAGAVSIRFPRGSPDGATGVRPSAGPDGRLRPARWPYPGYQPAAFTAILNHAGDGYGANSDHRPRTLPGTRG